MHAQNFNFIPNSTKIEDFQHKILFRNFFEHANIIWGKGGAVVPIRPPHATTPLFVMAVCRKITSCCDKEDITVTEKTV